ncbi:MAG: bifunctional folylpolyglutamate synthase/dihydrofolate synthase [Betaproteobacteria bacterium RBG_16_66_20]|nr:MAG: bifunctional folylpolyglutamate synthase/dihydrofolate synthase [Betaproteobacteria bacterium RBG_16_66_20]
MFVSARSLAGWLEYIERQHPQAIALGLERVIEVFSRLEISISCPILTVGGTNGKGSTCAMLEAVLRSAGYRTGLYTSPHLLRYNERVRIAGREADDAALCEAFAAVERARGAVPLTYFEFGTLAAFVLFSKENLDAAILEVGLGGRLDAVNVLDADCAVLTSVAIDHVEYLGDSREAIGREKAGIFRSGRPAVVADPQPPNGVLEEIRRVGARPILIGRDFGYRAQGTQWSYWGPAGKRTGLAHPALRGAMQLRNASAAFAALDSLRERLPIAMQDVRRALAGIALPGRFQVLPGRPQVILDVAHNPEAAAVLAANLADSGFAPETIAVFGMLRDKDIAGVVRAVAPRITRWHLATLPGPRGADARFLSSIFLDMQIQTPIVEHDTVAAALAAARIEAGESDKIIVFGSFLTVAGAYG